MKLFFFYDRNFVPLRDQMVASLEQSGGLADFTLCEDVLDDLKGNNRAGGGMPTYLYKSAKIGKALNDVDTDEIFLFTDVDVQYFQPVHEIVRECMADGTDIVFQQEFEDIGVNIGFMAMRKSAAYQPHPSAGPEGCEQQPLFRACSRDFRSAMEEMAQQHLGLVYGLLRSTSAAAGGPPCQLPHRKGPGS